MSLSRDGGGCTPLALMSHGSCVLVLCVLIGLCPLSDPARPCMGRLRQMKLSLSAKVRLSFVFSFFMLLLIYFILF